MKASSTRIPWFPLLPVLLICLFAPGCMKNKILIKLNRDGTGKIFVTRVFSQQLAAMYGVQTASLGEDNGKPPRDPFFNEAALKAAAGEFGPGVTFVKARKYSNAGSRGYIALYKFENINEIFVNMESLAGEDLMEFDMFDDVADGQEVEVADREENAFEFQFARGDINRLKIIIPPYPEVQEIDNDKAEDEEKDQDEDDRAAGVNEFRQEMYSMMSEAGIQSRAAMMMMSAGYTGNESQYDMMARGVRGTHLALEIEVDGTDVKMQASHPDKTRKNRLALIDMDMDKAVSDTRRVKRLMKRIEKANYDSPLEFLLATRKAPGMLLETNRNVTVTFK